MKKNAFNNDTNIFASGGAFLAWGVVQVGLWFIPDFVEQGGEGLWVMGLTIVFASVGRQLKYYLYDRKQPKP